MVKDEEGHIVNSKAEAQARWRRHFGNMEGGQLTTPDDLWRYHQRLHLANPLPALTPATYRHYWNLRRH